MMRLKNWSLLHPILLAIFPALQYYAANSSEALLINVLVPILFSVTLMGIVWLILKILIKDKFRSALITSSLLLLFFSYQHLSGFVYNQREVFPAITKPLAENSFFIYIIFLILLGLLVRKVANQRRAAGFLTILGAYLVVSSIIRIIPIEIARAKSATNLVSLRSDEVEKELENVPQAKTRPDVYYIVPDRYANNTTLKEFYHYDNSDFTNFLKDNGFYIAEQSTTNYPKTFLSLASSLNLQHITQLSELIGRDVADNTPVFTMVQNNMLSEFFQKQGYEFVYFGSWWEPTRINRHADLNINLYADSDEFLRKFGQTTALNPILNEIFNKGDILGFSDERVRDNHQYQFAELKKIAAHKSPKFVFVHMLIPHSPYVLDRNCQPVDDKEDGKDIKGYNEQLICVNNQFKEVITAILKNSKTPPIIVIQSDEGPFKVDEMNRHGEGINWRKTSSEAARIHMRIFNAYHLPGFDTSQLYQSVTPVNSFRLILNHYFDTKFPLLPDKNYYIPHLNNPYDFYEVTDIVDFNEK